MPSFLKFSIEEIISKSFHILDLKNATYLKKDSEL